MADLLGDEPTVETEAQQAETPRAPDQPYVGLALRWRPRKFDDLVGQESVAESLKNAIARGRISQAYLFCGPRGVGKTSSARILARAINCVEGPTPTPCGKCDFCKAIAAGSDMDVVEIDGASNNKVDDVRELREQVNFTPFAARYKVYIIDEVHMLSTGAFNALLKTLEEPPERVKFIFATTEPHKVPPTIRSRCQICNFGHISESDMVARLEKIVEKEPAIAIAQDDRQAVLDTIAHYAEGSMRDALVALDQVAALGDGQVSIGEVQGLLGLVDSDACLGMFEGICRQNTAELLRIVDQLVNGGRDLERIVRQLVRLVRDALVLKAGGPAELVRRTQAEMKRLNEIVGAVSLAQMINISQVLIGLEEQMRSGMPVRFALELAFIKLTALPGASDIGDLMKKLEAAGTAPEKTPAGSESRKSGSAASASSGKARASSAKSANPGAKRSAPSERTLAGASVMNRTDAPVLDPPPKIVKTEVGIPDVPPPMTPRSVDESGWQGGANDDFIVSEDNADFEAGERGYDPDETGIEADVTAIDAALTGEPDTAPPPISMGDPRAWLHEQLARDPSLAEMVERIKKMFGAREIALDGIPFG